MARVGTLVHVRRRREALGLSQVALAERVRLSRQSIGAIEAGKVSPAVDVALRLAKALDCQVEDLFGTAEEASVRAEPSVPGLSGRVAMAYLRDRWISYPLTDDGARLCADGVVNGWTAAEVNVAPVRTLAEVRDNVVVMGCATGLGLLTDRLNARQGAGRFLWMARSSIAALDALARQHTHVAGVHLVDARTGEANVADVRRLASTESIVLITFACWEAGIVLRAADAKRIRTARDLGRKTLRLVTRESGAGAQRLLERELCAAGHPVEVARKAHLRVNSHLDVARAVSLGAADAGVATRDVALAFGLAFVPLAEERYDLALPYASLSEPRVARLLDVLVSAGFRRELACMGYDVRTTGQRVAEVSAA